MKTYSGQITELPDNGVFVYGCNTEGRHGAGAARVAYEKFGAAYGKTGWVNESYGIITKDLTAKKHPSISRMQIVFQIERLYEDAKDYPELDFYVAYSGTGTNLNYYTPTQMAEMFVEASDGYVIPENMVFEEAFAKLIKGMQEKN
jgi:hypothetical protein